MDTNRATKDHVSALPRTLSRRAIGAGAVSIAATLGSGLELTRAQTATPAANTLQEASSTADQDGLSQEIIAAFRVLPGRKGLKVWAPADAGRPAWTAEINPDQALFIGSSFKAFVLAEHLRQLEATLDPSAAIPLSAQLNARLADNLDLNESIFSLDSPVLNAPLLTGQVGVLTAMEAMISRSDNTGADLILRAAGADNVQGFIDDIGLQHTRIPESTRNFIGYIIGLPDWRQTTWAQLNEETSGLTPRAIVNDTITMVSSPNDLVSFYARALQGDFFQHAATLAMFRMVLMQADAVAFSMPLGVSAFGKGGSITFNGENALSFAGGMYVPDRWVYFHLAINWTDAEGPDGAAVQAAYIAAAKTIFTLVRDRLGR